MTPPPDAQAYQIRNVVGMGSRIWTTKEGVRMKWRDMTVSHLRNTANFLRRASHANISAMYMFSAGLQGEMAQDAMDSAIMDAEDHLGEAERYASDMEDYAGYRARSLKK